MPDHRLTPRHAIGGDAPKRIRCGTIAISEGPDLAIASLAARQGGTDACRESIAELTGDPAPDPGRIAGGDVEALWSGPDQWLLLAPHDDHEMLAGTLKDRLGAAGSVTEQTDGWTCISLTGDRTGPLFDRVCMLDTEAAAPGFAARSPIHHIACFVIRDAAGWRVLGPRSSARSLFDALAHAARTLEGTDS